MTLWVSESKESKFGVVLKKCWAEFVGAYAWSSLYHGIGAVLGALRTSILLIAGLESIILKKGIGTRSGIEAQCQEEIMKN